MNTGISISKAGITVYKKSVYVLCIVLLLVVSAHIVFAEKIQPPKASFDRSQVLVFKTNPTITGLAENLISPLHIDIIASSSLKTTVFSKDVATSTGPWSAIVYPPIPIGTYQAVISSAGKVLDYQSLAIGATVPTITLDKVIQPYDVADGHLIRFSIHATTPIGVAQLRFKIIPYATSIDTITLYGFTDPDYSQAIATSTDGTIATTIFDATSSTATLMPDSPIEIPAGATYYFDLDGVVTPIDVSYSITTTLLSDSPIDMGQNIGDLASTSNFIWSPNSFGMTSDTDTDWANGGSVPDLLFGLTTERYAQPTLSCDVEADTNIVPGTTPVTLTWSSSGASRAVWEDGTLAMLSGIKTVTASTTHTYVLNLSGSLGSTQCFTTITVGNPASSSSSSTVILNPSNVSTSTPPANFTATPMTGLNPLAVSFTGSVNNTKSCSASTYTFAYGDNSTTTISVPTKLCKPQLFTLKHTYNNAGTYIAKIYFGSFNKGTTTPTLIQSQQITVNKKVAFVPTSLLANISSAIGSGADVLWLWVKELSFFK